MKSKKILFSVIFSLIALGAFLAKDALAELAAIWTAPFREMPSASIQAKCPPEMVWVEAGKFCIDKYEASNGGGAYYVDINGDGDTDDTAVDVYGDGTTFNETTPTAKAVSVANADPWVSINQVDAKAACMAAGKNLATNYELLLAAKGTPDPHSSAPAVGTEPCQIWNTGSWPDYSGRKPDGSTFTDRPAGTNSIKTGTATSCVSDAGAYDLIGNVWEWTDNVINNGLHPVTGMALPSANGIRGLDIYGLPNITGSSTADYNYDYFWINTDGYRGFLRGGSWGDASRVGAFALYLNNAPSNTNYNIGFRCAR
jgi:formylglycine-generating enzyme required for sulfatase activity